MQSITNIATYIPYIIAVGICITSLTVTIVVSRVITINTSGLVLKITSILLAGVTMFFYAVIWLIITLLNPKENYIGTISTWYFLTGILPAIFIYLKGNTYNKQSKNFPSPEQTITNEENKNE